MADRPYTDRGATARWTWRHTPRRTFSVAAHAHAAARPHYARPCHARPCRNGGIRRSRQRAPTRVGAGDPRHDVQADTKGSADGALHGLRDLQVRHSPEKAHRERDCTDRRCPGARGEDQRHQHLAQPQTLHGQAGVPRRAGQSGQARRATWHGGGLRARPSPRSSPPPAAPATKASPGWSQPVGPRSNEVSAQSAPPTPTPDTVRRRV